MDIITFIQIYIPGTTSGKSSVERVTGTKSTFDGTNRTASEQCQFFCLQRKCMVFIFQQNHTLSGCLSCQCRIVNLPLCDLITCTSCQCRRTRCCDHTHCQCRCHGTSDFSVTFFHSLLLLLPVYTFCSMIINFTQFSFDFPCKIIRFTCKFLLCIRIYSQINQKQQRFLSPLLLFLKKLRFKIPARPFLPEMPDSL